MSTKRQKKEPIGYEKAIENVIDKVFRPIKHHRIREYFVSLSFFALKPQTKGRVAPTLLIDGTVPNAESA